MNLSLLLLGCAVTALGTGLGALPAVFFNRISERTQDILMGFSAGVMLAASSFSLILPAINMAQTLTTRNLSAIFVGLLVLSGGAFLHVCNEVVPHEHFQSGREGITSIHLKRIWLFVFAITLHNFPEGLAVGSGMGSQDIKIGMPILIGIGLQDIPEGFVVAAALMAVGYTVGQSLLVAFITGLVEAAAVVVGYFATTMITSLLPWALAFAGGAMIYVVSDEIIPESHRKNSAKQATAGLMVGFVLMMILDIALS